MLDVEDSKKGGMIKVQRMNGGPTQLWKWEGNVLKCQRGHVLHVEGGNMSEGTNVVAEKECGYVHEQWEMKNDKIASRLNDFVLEIKELNHDEGIEVVLSPLDSTELLSQSWKLVYTGKYADRIILLFGHPAFAGLLRRIARL